MSADELYHTAIALCEENPQLGAPSESTLQDRNALLMWYADNEREVFPVLTERMKQAKSIFRDRSAQWVAETAHSRRMAHDHSCGETSTQARLNALAGKDLYREELDVIGTYIVQRMSELKESFNRATRRRKPLLLLWFDQYWGQIPTQLLSDALRIFRIGPMDE